MKGRDWFIVGTRLIGLWILYQGALTVLRYFNEGMFFEAQMWRYQPQSPVLSLLIRGGAEVVFAFMLLLNAHLLANWCYGKEVLPNRARHADEDEAEYEEEEEDEEYEEEDDEYDDLKERTADRRTEEKSS